MNPEVFLRIVGRLLGRSLPMAALLSGHLGCGKCYPASREANIQRFTLPELAADGGDANTGCFCVDCPIPPDGGAIDGGVIDGGAVDGGATDGGTVRSCPPMNDAQSRCMQLCSTEAERQSLTVFGATASIERPSGSTVCECDFGFINYSAQCLPPGAIFGRRPAGFVPHASPDASALGQYFAHAAQCEAASVLAFLIVAEELEAHGAPTPLVNAARRAAEQEFHHARLTSALVTRFGGRMNWPQIPRREVRSLLNVALDNEVEGCVGEAYAAFVAAWQLHAATDLGVRVAMSAIAPDEASHAALAFAISAWVRGRLNWRELRCLDEARHQAVSKLQQTILDDPRPALGLFAGLPTAEISQRFLAAASPR